MERSSGILMHMSSLPSPYGIGTMGKCAYDFVDFLSRTAQKYWQLLPLGPTSVGNSPYSSFSTFAGNPYFIDLDMLVDDDLLETDEITAYSWGSNEEMVDFSLMAMQRDELLRLAFSRRGEKMKAEAEAFLDKNRRWLENYALYMALKRHFKNDPWTKWPEDIRKRYVYSVRYYMDLLHEEVSYHVFQQYLFFSQWEKLRKYAGEKSVKFIGDIPIYVALDSADVWSEPQFFQLDDQYQPTMVSGVPPDAFSEEGQLWGNPLYDWDAMQRDGFGWWIRRIEGAEKLFDMVRIDHFRGLESYWAVPAEDKNAMNGKWMPGPGMALVGVLKNWFHNIKFIAEDLGVITPQVRQLLDDSGFPGMKVLMFAFDAAWESSYIPHRCVENSICFIGTHDNDTIGGWLTTEKPENLEYARKYMNITEEEGWNWGLIRTGMSTVCSLFVVQMQDVLGLDGSARMNVPGVADNNWSWRMKADAIDKALEAKLLDYTRMYRRGY